MIVNGNSISLVLGETLLQLLEREQYDPSVVVVERNGSIVKKDLYSTVLLEEDDTIEVISFVGGG